jgi:predicted esterase
VASEQTGRLHIPSSLLCEYIIREGSQKERIILLLHGYAQTGAHLYEALKPALTDKDLILVPNGPFPIPRKKGLGYEMGFSWYFFDPFTKSYYIRQDFAGEFLKSLFSQLKMEQLALTAIGFSQGGYLAPFLKDYLPKLDHVIGLGCEFIEAVQNLKGLSEVKMDAIHGLRDEIIKIDEAKDCFEKVQPKSRGGSFYQIDDCAHEVNAAAIDVLRHLLKS